MHDTKESIHPRYSRLSAVVLAIFLSSCLTIGDTGGGPGMMLSHHLSIRMQGSFEALYLRNPTPNKVRFGEMDIGCQKMRFNCLALIAGMEIEERPDVLRKVEDLLRDPCVLFPEPKVLAERLKHSQQVGDIRTKNVSDYFECFKSIGERRERYIEIQTVEDPTAWPPLNVIKVRSYRVPNFARDER